MDRSQLCSQRTSGFAPFNRRIYLSTPAPPPTPPPNPYGDGPLSCHTRFPINHPRMRALPAPSITPRLLSACCEKLLNRTPSHDSILGRPSPSKGRLHRQCSCTRSFLECRGECGLLVGRGRARLYLVAQQLMGYFPGTCWSYIPARHERVPGAAGGGGVGGWRCCLRTGPSHFLPDLMVSFEDSGSSPSLEIWILLGTSVVPLFLLNLVWKRGFGEGVEMGFNPCF